MVLTGTPSVVGFDVESAIEAAHAVVGDDLLIGVEYDREAFNILYVTEPVSSLYTDDAQMESHFDSIHSYVHLDFTERELFKDLFVDPVGVRAFVTYMGNMIAIRFMAGEDGLFLGLAPGAEVTDVVSQVEAAIET
ncbi:MULTISPECIES: hypothetical protein [unclassified Haladaptatus]|uniref:hypothetical protein n=1 Tax=unclassified Haladaptatus TaxID=2622732 RepID=UPI0023E7A19C|nr:MULTISPECIES: hypothetical protein [unclassified Haladaptatus]